MVASLILAILIVSLSISQLFILRSMRHWENVINIILKDLAAKTEIAHVFSVELCELKCRINECEETIEHHTNKDRE